MKLTQHDNILIILIPLITVSLLVSTAISAPVGISASIEYNETTGLVNKSVEQQTNDYGSMRNVSFASKVDYILNQEYKAYIKKKEESEEKWEQERKDAHDKKITALIVTLSCVFGGPIYILICFYIFREIEQQVSNYKKMVDYIRSDAKNKEQNKVLMYLRIIFSWKTFSLFLICVINSPGFILCFIFYLIALVLNEMFGTKEYPDIELNNVVNPAGDTSTANPQPAPARVQNQNVRKTTKITRADIEAYQFDQEVLLQAAKDFRLPDKGHYSFTSYRDLGVNHAHLVKNEDSCLICLEEYKPSDFVTVLPCQHIAHHVCLDDSRETILNQGSMMKCPVCQLNLVRHQQYCVEKDLDQTEVKFENK